MQLNVRFYLSPPPKKNGDNLFCGYVSYVSIL